MKRLISILIVVALLICCLPMSAYAASNTITLSISQPSDNCRVTFNGATWDFSNQDVIEVGYFSNLYYKMASGLKFNNIQIPQGVTITSAVLTFVAYDNVNSLNAVNSILTVENKINPLPFSTVSDYFSRVPTSNSVVWDAIAPWAIGGSYNSPDISSLIQPVISRTDWYIGSPIVILWSDASNRSTNSNGVCRRAYSYAQNINYAPKLTITFTYNTSYTNYDLTPINNKLETLTDSMNMIANGLSELSGQMNNMQEQVNGLNQTRVDLSPITNQVNAANTALNGIIKSEEGLNKNMQSVLAAQQALNTEVANLNSKLIESDKQQKSILSMLNTFKMVGLGIIILVVIVFLYKTYMNKRKNKAVVGKK
jgi:type IV pilus assembly protein PilY1